MGVPKRLTEMQMKFANELVHNEGRKTAYQCAIDAGYAEERARVTASELQSPKMYPLVAQYIGELRTELQKKYSVTFENHIAELAQLRNDARDKKAWSAAVNAEIARGKAAGLYIEQKIIRTGKLDDLSEEELDKRIAETLDQYSPILNAIDVEELKEEVKSNQQKIRLDPQLRNKLTTEVIDYDLSSSSSSSDTQSSSSSVESTSSDSSKGIIFLTITYTFFSYEIDIFHNSI
jgi:phage terminase small subunit